MFSYVSGWENRCWSCTKIKASTAYTFPSARFRARRLRVTGLILLQMQGLTNKAVLATVSKELFMETFSKLGNVKDVSFLCQMLRLAVETICSKMRIKSDLLILLQFFYKKENVYY
jgi:hypothetical protein